MFYAKNFPKSKIIAVEPFQENYRLLKENLAFYKNERLIQSVFADENNKIVKIYDNNSWAYGLLKVAINSIEVEEVNMVTLDELLKDFHNRDNFIPKIDIEGSEKLIFDHKANWNLIDTFQIIIVEIHDGMFPGQKIAKGLLRWATDYFRDVCIQSENLWFFKNR